MIDDASADVSCGAGHENGHDFHRTWHLRFRHRHDRIADMQAVLFDMDGTLVDSEKLWDISLAALYEELGGRLTPEVRASMVGGSAEDTIRTSIPTWAWSRIRSRWQSPSAGCTTTPRNCSTAGCRGATARRNLLEALAAEGTPMALVTNTQRALTERALNSIGRHYFSATVCGDEVPTGKPAPDPYLRAAELLGLDPAECLAIEDSVTGTAAAEGAGCPVLVVPNDVEVPRGPRRQAYFVAGRTGRLGPARRLSPN